MTQQKTLNFIAGLPRSGSNLITAILNQNPEIHGQSISSLHGVLDNTLSTWDSIEQNRVYTNLSAKFGVMRGIVNGYYNHVDKPTVFDRDFGWVSHIGLIESILERPIKMLVCVRNPAEIITSYERMRNRNPLFYSRVDHSLKGGSSIASRAYHIAGPEGILGICHRNIKDAVTMGYLDRMLFIDYNRYCSNPKSQTRRIYEFFEMTPFDHDFEKIEQTEHYNDQIAGYDSALTLKPSLEKTTVNCVKYIGLDLFEQYNREIFWTPWI